MYLRQRCSAFFLVGLISFCFIQADNVRASALSIEERRAIAKKFVGRLKGNLNFIEKRLVHSGVQKKTNKYSDGEVLLLQPVLGRRVRLDDVIQAIVHEGKVLVSIRDFSDILRLAIDVEGQKASGWYLQEDKRFDLDIDRSTVITDLGTFDLPDNILVQDDDIYVPFDALSLWTGIETKTLYSTQELFLTSEIPFPHESELARKKKRANRRRVPEPKLPIGSKTYGTIGEPVIDVSTSSSYRKFSTQEDGVDSHSATITTVGDVAYGTLATQSRYNNFGGLQSLRASYRQEQADTPLLKLINARRFEIGDINTVNSPFLGSNGQELGVRITNSDPTRRFVLPQTAISGNAIPGWDVELYRNNQFISILRVGDDGFYEFRDIDLFNSDNAFRLVFYGPQGERVEEDVFIPVEFDALSRGEGVYDVSVSLNDEVLYDPEGSNRIIENQGGLNFSALYELPLAQGKRITAAFNSTDDEDERVNVASLGLSQTVMQFLLNTELAVEDDGDFSSILTARRDFGPHQFAVNADVTSFGFDDIDNILGNEVSYGYGFRLDGPIPFSFGRAPRYNIRHDASYSNSFGILQNTSVAFNTSLSHFIFNGRVNYITGAGEDDLSSFVGVTGTYGRNRLRLNADYDIKPEKQLNSLTAQYRWRYSDKLEFEAQAQRFTEQNRTNYRARLDWQAGFVHISPTVSYNTEDDFFAGLDTRFGLFKDPSSDKWRSLDKGLANSGSLSAFVYLDKDGNGIFDSEDEPLPDVVVLTPQNSGRGLTNKKGIALFTNMARFRRTDVYVDQESLADPTWVSGFEGVSVIPREGYIAQVDFPVHISGEIDGLVYAKAVPLPLEQRQKGYQEPKPLFMRNVKLDLYNDKGEVQTTVETDSGGFYYIPLIPPGRYFLSINEESAKRRNIIRPEPQPIEIKYDGTVIYGNDILVAVGEGDVPNEFVANLDDYKANHPHIDFDQEYELVLNLGEFNSRLMMSLVWYKLRSRYKDILKAADLFVPPTESFADIKTGKHTLRVGLQNENLSQAYNRCRALIARNISCKVEIFPNYIKQAHFSGP